MSSIEWPVTLPAVAQSQLWRVASTLAVMGGLVWRARGPWVVLASIALALLAAFWLLYWPRALRLDAEGFRMIPLVPLFPRRKILWSEVSDFRAYTIYARGRSVTNVGYDREGQKAAWWRFGQPPRGFMPIFAAPTGGDALNPDELAALLNRYLAAARG